MVGSLGAIEALHIPEIIREAGPEGIHVREIGKKTSQDPSKIGATLTRSKNEPSLRKYYSTVAPSPCDQLHFPRSGS